VACKFGCRKDIERLLKIAGSHVHCRSDNISEAVQRRNVVTTDINVAYRIAQFPMTLSDLQGHSPIAGHFKCDFWYILAADDIISTNIARRTFSLRHLSFL